MDNKKTAFIGSGIIGAGLACNALINGYKVFIQDVIPTDQVTGRIEEILSILTEVEVISTDKKAKAQSNLTVTNSVEEAVADAFFICEACPDNMELKKKVYSGIEQFADETAIIASTSTMLMPSDLQRDLEHPERFLIGHPFHPSYLIPLIEVCPGEKTSESTMERAMEFYRSAKKYPIVCHKEVQGAIVNRLCWGINSAAKQSIADGICSAEELDRAFMYGPGIRMAITGLLLTMDLGVAGGYRYMAEKYGGKNTPNDEVIADQIDKEIANRLDFEMRDREGISKYRDKMIAEILKLQNMM